MSGSTRVSVLGLLVSAACGFPRPSNVGGIGGHVHGLWDGTDGVVLRLQAEGIDALLAVPTNGIFTFPDPLAEGTRYTVVVAANPPQHVCVVEAGGSGTFADADVTTISIGCTGPSMTLALSGPWGWVFDPTLDTQTFSGSIAMQDVALTISGSTLASATIAGSVATLGQQTAPIALPLGSTTVPIALTAAGGLAKNYQLVFERGASLLDQVVYGKASNTGAGDAFGDRVALSGDTLAVSTQYESSSATGVNGDQNNDNAPSAGAVYVFVRHGMTWTQQAYIKASNAGRNDQFGFSVALSGDTLAVGALGEASNATGINGDQTDNSAYAAGAVYVFARTGTAWTQQAYIKASNTQTPIPPDIAGDNFGCSVALLDDTLAVGAVGEGSNAIGVNHDQTNNNAPASGAVYVFVRSGQTWTQQAYVKASNTSTGDGFGFKVALSTNTLAVSTPYEASHASGVNGDQTNDSAPGAGAVYVFIRNDTTWTQQSYIKASNTAMGSNFGSAIALSGDRLAVAAINEASNATGIDGNQSDTSARFAGAVYVFDRHGTRWAQQAYVKAPNTIESGYFGSSVALSGDLLAVGAIGDSSRAIGVNGDQSDTTAVGSGAVHVFGFDDGHWMQRLYVKGSNTERNDNFGSAVAISDDTIAISAIGESSSATGISPMNGQSNNGASAAGAVYLFR